jgi:transposase InsO family protein
MGEALLTPVEVADLKGCSLRYVQSLASSGKLHAETIEVKGRGTATQEYRIPLSALDQKLQLKYKRRQKQALTLAKTDTALAFETEPEALPLNFESITAEERKQIVFWKNILDEWDTFRATSSLPKGDADIQFEAFINTKLSNTHPHINISVKTLHRKRKALYSQGEAALIDRRGKHSGHSKKLTQEMQDIFEFYYLHNSKKSVSLCKYLTGLELKRLYGETPELPSDVTFRRASRNIPLPYVMYFREGQKAYTSNCAPYIKRMYDDLEPNDIWVADGHTFDIMVKGKDGKPFRPFLSAFMDVRTRKLVGWMVTDKLSGDVTIYALKRGVEKYGAPKSILVDNGREYLFTDFSGDAGFRKKAKRKEGEFKPPTILETLGIDIRVAIPKNARAKAIERAFETVKETFSKLFDSYTGGNVLEKPDTLEKVLKHPDKLTPIDEFVSLVDTYIKGYYNKQPHNGEGMWGRSPDDVYAELFNEKRVVPKDKLHLMFMRYSKDTIRVGKNGVTLRIYGEELQYSNEDLWRNHFGEKVYVRYSPDDLSSVRVYDEENRFICVAELETKLSYNANKEELQAKTREKKAQEKTVKQYKQLKNTQAQDALDAIIDEAADNMEIPEDVNAKIIKALQSGETLAEPLQKAAGAETLKIDFNAAAQRMREQRASSL